MRNTVGKSRLNVEDSLSVLMKTALISLEDIESLGDFKSHEPLINAIVDLVLVIRHRSYGV